MPEEFLHTSYSECILSSSIGTEGLPQFAGTSSSSSSSSSSRRFSSSFGAPFCPQRTKPYPASLHTHGAASFAVPVEEVKAARSIDLAHIRSKIRGAVVLPPVSVVEAGVAEVEVGYRRLVAVSDVRVRVCAAGLAVAAVVSALRRVVATQRIALLCCGSRGNIAVVRAALSAAIHIPAHFLSFLAPEPAPLTARPSTRKHPVLAKASKFYEEKTKRNRNSTARAPKAVLPALDFTLCASFLDAQGVVRKVVAQCLRTAEVKPGGVIDELAENLSGPDGGCVCVKLAALHHILTALSPADRETTLYTPLQRLVLFVTSLEGPVLDALMGFPDVPSRKQRADSTAPQQKLAEYRACYTETGLRNVDLPAVLGTLLAGDSASSSAGLLLRRWSYTLLTLLSITSCTTEASSRPRTLYRTMSGPDAERHTAHLQAGSWLLASLPSLCSLTPMVSDRHITPGHLLLWEIDVSGKDTALPSAVKGTALLPALSQIQISSIERGVEVLPGVWGSRVVGVAYGALGAAHSFLGDATGLNHIRREVLCGVREAEVTARLCTAVAMPQAVLLKVDLQHGYSGDETTWPVLTDTQLYTPLTFEVQPTHPYRTQLYSPRIPSWPGWIASHSCIDISASNLTAVASRACTTSKCTTPYVTAPKAFPSDVPLEWYIYFGVAKSTRGVHVGVRCEGKEERERVVLFNVHHMEAAGVVPVCVEYVRLRYDPEETCLRCAVNGNDEEVLAVEAGFSEIRPYATLGRVGAAVESIERHAAIRISMRRLVEEETEARPAFSNADVAVRAEMQTKELCDRCDVQSAGLMQDEALTFNTLLQKQLQRRRDVLDTVEGNWHLHEAAGRAVLVKEWLSDVFLFERQGALLGFANSMPHVAEALHTRSVYSPAAQSLSRSMPATFPIPRLATQRASVTLWAMLPSKVEEIQFLLTLGVEDGPQVVIRTCSDGCGHETVSGMNVSVERGSERLGVAQPFYFRPGRWAHIAVVVDGARLVLYRDGCVVDEFVWSGALLEGMVISRGMCLTPTAKISDIRVFSRPLPQEDVAHLASTTSAIHPSAHATHRLPSVLHTLKTLPPLHSSMWDLSVNWG